MKVGMVVLIALLVIATACPSAAEETLWDMTSTLDYNQKVNTLVEFLNCELVLITTPYDEQIWVIQTEPGRGIDLITCYDIYYRLPYTPITILWYNYKMITNVAINGFTHEWCYYWDEYTHTYSSNECVKLQQRFEQYLIDNPRK